MIGRRCVFRTVVGTGLLTASVAALVVVGAKPALAHPLGNFSVNHYDGLTATPDGLELDAVVDLAEIPTRQESVAIDTDGDEVLARGELAATATTWCPELAAGLTTSVDGAAVTWELREAGLVVESGTAGLDTLRLTCRLEVAVDLSDGAAITFVDDYRGDRVGWHEITAVGEGLSLADSSVPGDSASNRLRDYPGDLLSSPLDVRSATITVAPGAGGGAAGAAATLDTSGDPFSRLVSAGDALLQSTVGRDDLTPLVGALALLLAALLGAGHALLPGHGKTVMAAYLAGRRGTRVDALIVGGTVTLTHTAGVLLLGMLLTVGSAIAGEVILQRLGVVSGLLIAAIGVGLLRDALRARARRRAADRSRPSQDRSPTTGPATGRPATVPALAGHAHDAGSDAGHAHDAGGHTHGGEVQAHVHGSHRHGDDEHSHRHAWDDQDFDPRFSRRGLVGMAVAGGLVPSPSALVVLLGSIALGRTLFGMTLVLAYGVGMAATLTIVGLLLVRLRGRLDRSDPRGRIGQRVARLSAMLPLATASLVLVVGVGLVVRAMTLSG